MQGRCNANPTSNSIIVLVTDECPGCLANQWDIQALAFGRVRRPHACLPLRMPADS